MYRELCIAFKHLYITFRFTTFFTYALTRFESDHGHEIIDIIISERVFRTPARRTFKGKIV